jgi:hypothetical protein
MRFGLVETKTEFGPMITLEDCLAFCGLTEEEVLAIAEHEHLPEIAARALASYLLRQEHGTDKIRDMIVDDTRLAQLCGDRKHPRRTKGTFLVGHFRKKPCETMGSNCLTFAKSLFCCRYASPGVSTIESDTYHTHANSLAEVAAKTDLPVCLPLEHESAMRWTFGLRDAGCISYWDAKCRSKILIHNIHPDIWEWIAMLRCTRADSLLKREEKPLSFFPPEWDASSRKDALK